MKTVLHFLLIIIFSSFFLSCSDDGDNGPGEQNIGDVGLGTILLSQTEILEDTDNEIIISIAIPSNVVISDSVLSLEKLDASNNSLGEIDKLYDNGDFAYTGDDIAGDNLFSAKVNIHEQAEGIVKLQIKGNVTTEEGKGIGYSEIAELRVFSNVTEEEFAEVVNTEDKASDKFEEFLSGNINNVESAISETAQWLLTQPGISNVTSYNTTAIDIEFESGLFGGIIFSEKNDDGSLITRGGVFSGDDRKKGKRIPVAYQTIGTTSEKPSILNKLSGTEALDPDVIGNKNVLIYSAFESAFSPHIERAKIISNLEKSEFKFQITSLVDQNATVKSLFDITKYGFVILATHGSGGTSFLTGEIADTNQIVWGTTYKALYSAGKIGITGRITISKSGTVERKEKVYSIRSSFISGLSNSFPNSVILNNSCQGTKTSSLADAFIGKGAKAYYGYDKSVSSSFCVSIADSISKRLAVDLKNTSEAYLNWSDPISYNAKFEYKKGSHDVHYALNLVNGDFEFGNLDGWTVEGDGRNLSKLSYVFPNGGKYMGIISTGLGFTTATGSIFQSFRVEEDQSKITIYWNFLSEEFLEYIDSYYQDYFKVTIVDKDGNEDVLMNKTIDIIASEFGAQKFKGDDGEVPKPGSLNLASPDIVFDKGDVYMTGWQSNTFDITGYRGKIITIIISAGDVGDSIFDTAILLDNIIVN
jgi:hypothetical protein